MAKSSAVIVLGACALALAIGIQAGSAALADVPAVERDVANESLTVNYSTTQSVDKGSADFGYRDTETVENASGATLVEGTDYDFNVTSGNVSFFNTTNTTANNTATIDYTYLQQDPEAARFGGFVGDMMPVLGLVLFFVVAGVIMDYVGMF
jgi:hypothetical protein